MAAIEVRRTDELHAVRVALSGELDIATAGEAERQILAAEQDAQGVLVVDLSGLSFMDSTGLRLILGADVRLRAAGNRLVLVPGPEAVHRVFRLALLEDRLEFQPPTTGTAR